jgi:hypothetical protein
MRISVDSSTNSFTSFQERKNERKKERILFEKYCLIKRQTSLLIQTPWCKLQKGIRGPAKLFVYRDQRFNSKQVNSK